jgi:hypothetical protein
MTTGWAFKIEFGSTCFTESGTLPIIGVTNNAFHHAFLAIDLFCTASKPCPSGPDRNHNGSAACDVLEIAVANEVMNRAESRGL